jgi:hypothetical protein
VLLAERFDLGSIEIVEVPKQFLLLLLAQLGNEKCQVAPLLTNKNSGQTRESVTRNFESSEKSLTISVMLSVQTR